MSKKKTHPRTNIQYAQRTFQNQSDLSVNHSHLNIGYLTVQENTVSSCFHCKHLGNSALMSACDCVDRLFHEHCLKQWLKIKVSASSTYVSTQNGISSIKCDQCEYEIKFRQQPKSRVRNCSQLGFYCSTHKGITLGIILAIILALACITYLLLLYFGVAPVCECNLEKSVFMIALAVISGLLILIIGCCCLDCIRVKQIRISTMYNREGRSHRSSRSQRSYSNQKTTKMVVESIQ